MKNTLFWDKKMSGFELHCTSLNNNSVKLSVKISDGVWSWTADIHIFYIKTFSMYYKVLNFILQILGLLYTSTCIIVQRTLKIEIFIVGDPGSSHFSLKELWPTMGFQRSCYRYMYFGGLYGLVRVSHSTFPILAAII